MASAVAVAVAPKPRVIRPKKNVKKNTVPEEPVEVQVPVETPPPVEAPAPESPARMLPSPDPPSYYCDPELFVSRQIKRTIMIPFYRITKNVNMKQLLTTELAKQIEGKCSIEGYICPSSVTICSHSCGTLHGGNIVFDIVAECLICFPDEHRVIKCVAKTITQAGVRAGATQLLPGKTSPIEVFLSRDMNIKNSELFSRIEENDILTVEIIGRRFVLNDTHVTIIAMLIDAESPS